MSAFHRFRGNGRRPAVASPRAGRGGPGPVADPRRAQGGRAAACVACIVAASGALHGCGGGRGGAAAGLPAFTEVGTIWDAPIRPRPAGEGMAWAEGKVTGVSLDGSEFDARIMRGAVVQGERLGVYVAVPRRAGPHYLKDEARELYVAEARVVAVAGDTCKAKVLDRASNAPVSTGDRVIARIPR